MGSDISLKAEHCSAFLLDTHCHLSDLSFFDVKENLVNCGLSVTTQPDAFFSIALSPLFVKTSQTWHSAIGLHPWCAYLPIDWTIFEKILLAYPYLAIGEIGLDGLPNKPDWLLQCEVFMRQLLFAQKYDRLVSIHLVKDRGEAFSLIKKSGVKRVIIHGFCGSLALARQYQSQNWLLGIGPRCLFPLTDKFKSTLLGLDQSCFVLESDAPYTHQEKKSPDIIYWVAKQLAVLWRKDVCEVVEMSYQNWQNLRSKKC